tara:strand:- start:1704 stop:1892 length:189 start_codon:yes stop_codon:yes gene_type:complete
MTDQTRCKALVSVLGATPQDVEAGKCPFCKKEIDTDEFTDEVSHREYLISGLCQGCQDETFG